MDNYNVNYDFVLDEPIRNPSDLTILLFLGEISSEDYIRFNKKVSEFLSDDNRRINKCDLIQK